MQVEGHGIVAVVAELLSVRIDYQVNATTVVDRRVAVIASVRRSTSHRLRAVSRTEC